ncbi:unnamed protein product [Rhizophagus irregularis]|nr:unnamed protein product [Rhizophagus irregularis]
MDIRRHHWFSWSKINDYDLIKITLKNPKRNVNNKAFLRWTMGILMNVLQTVEQPVAESHGMYIKIVHEKLTNFWKALKNTLFIWMMIICSLSYLESHFFWKK